VGKGNEENLNGVESWVRNYTEKKKEGETKKKLRDHHKLRPKRRSERRQNYTERREIIMKISL
jgi:hypothetical protein